MRKINNHPYYGIFFTLVFTLFLTIWGPFTMQNSYAQGFHTDFGKNRVQYHDVIWSFYESENFVTYFYQGGHDLGKYVVTTAEEVLPEIESLLEWNNRAKVEIMVYHNLSDLKQTNIGLAEENTNTGGVTKIIGNKIFIHFNGDYHHLRKQIREGVTRISLDKMIFGRNIQEVLQNAVLLNLPDWYVNGLVAYAGEEWNTDLDNRLKESIQQKRLTNFNRLEGEEATFAGHALWHYIATQHGKESIPNILYLTRINRSVESGLMYVLGKNLKTTVNEFNRFHENIYVSESLDTQALPDKENLFLQTNRYVKRRNVHYDNMKISPDGRYLAYTTNELGQHKVVLHDRQENKKKVILRNGFRSRELPMHDNYPLLAWDFESRQLVIIYEKRDEIRLMVYNTGTGKKETKPIAKFQQVVDVCFTPNNKKLILSAVQKGQIDLFVYSMPNTKTSRLTNDYFSDLQPHYVQSEYLEGILFVSDRLNDTLDVVRLDTIMPQGKYDVFFYNLNADDDEPTLVQVTKYTFGR